MKTMATLNDCVTITAAAREIGVSKQRMHKIIEDHHAETIVIHSRLKMIEVAELERIKRERERNKKNR